MGAFLADPDASGAGGERLVTLKFVGSDAVAYLFQLFHGTHFNLCFSTGVAFVCTCHTLDR